MADLTQIGVEFASHIYWAKVGDVVFVMDAHRGEYFGLDPNASDLWLRLVGTGGAGDQAVEELIKAAYARGWVIAAGNGLDRVKEPAQHRLRRRPRVSISAAYWCLIRAFVSLKYVGFGRAYAWAQSMEPMLNSHSPTQTDPAVFGYALKAFSKAEHMVVSRLGMDDCLPRSLALFVFLRGGGFPVCHCIGVRRYPFQAHAWVESDGVPLLVPPDSIIPFTRIATIGHRC